MLTMEQVRPDSGGDRTVQPSVVMWPLLICVLGPLRIPQAGQSVPIRGEKMSALLRKILFQGEEDALVQLEVKTA